MLDVAYGQTLYCQFLVFGESVVFLISSRYRLSNLSCRSLRGSISSILTGTTTHSIGFYLTITAALPNCLRVQSLMNRHSGIMFSYNIRPLGRGSPCSMRSLHHLTTRRNIMTLNRAKLSCCCAPRAGMHRRRSFVRRVRVNHRLGGPIVIRAHSTHTSALTVLHRRGIASYNNMLRYFARSERATNGLLSLKFCVSFSNVIAFHGTRRLHSTTHCIPLSQLLIRASSPCLTPMPRQKGRGRPTVIHSITRCVTILGNITIRRLTRMAASGFTHLFRVSTSHLRSVH